MIRHGGCFLRPLAEDDFLILPQDIDIVIAYNGLNRFCPTRRATSGLSLSMLPFYQSWGLSAALYLPFLHCTGMLTAWKMLHAQHHLTQGLTFLDSFQCPAEPQLQALSRLRYALVCVAQEFRIPEQTSHGVLASHWTSKVLLSPQLYFELLFSLHTCRLIYY